MFVPPLKNKPDKKPQPSKTTAAAQSTKESVQQPEKEESSQWNVLDSCCLAPYKVLFAPITMVAKAVTHKVK
jgi:hypothetical protein